MMTSGVDIIKIDRIDKILNKNRDLFLNKIFTKSEIEYINKKGNNPRTVAGLYASKEAIVKAIGTGIGKIGWKDMEVTHDHNGKPLVNISDEVEYLLKDIKINKFDLSISHDGEYAIAFVVGYKED